MIWHISLYTAGFANGIGNKTFPRRYDNWFDIPGVLRNDLRWVLNQKSRLIKSSHFFSIKTIQFRQKMVFWGENRTKTRIYPKQIFLFLFIYLFWVSLNQVWSLWWLKMTKITSQQVWKYPQKADSGLFCPLFYVLKIWPLNRAGLLI